MRIDLKKLQLSKLRFILPNLFTCGSMALGVFSIMLSAEGRFSMAASMLVISLCCDILDGRIARLASATSDIGMQMDSLSDLISFGLAPAMMMYMMALNRMGVPGVLIAILFVLCSGLRLAKFNVLAIKGIGSKNYFAGLPTPAGAGLLISFVLSYELLTPAGESVNFHTIKILMKNMPLMFSGIPMVMVVLSLLEVSNIPYPNFKHVRPTGRLAAQLAIPVIILAVLIIKFPQNMFFLIFACYIIGGFIFAMTQIVSGKYRLAMNMFAK